MKKFPNKTLPYSFPFKPTVVTKSQPNTIHLTILPIVPVAVVDLSSSLPVASIQQQYFSYHPTSQSTLDTSLSPHNTSASVSQSFLHLNLLVPLPLIPTIKSPTLTLS